MGIGRRAVGSGFEFRARVSFHLSRVANSKVRGIRNIDLVELHREDRLWCCGVSCEGVHFIRVSRTVFQLLFLKKLCVCARVQAGGALLLSSGFGV